MAKSKLGSYTELNLLSCIMNLKESQNYTIGLNLKYIHPNNH